jgi:phosphotriesterase-related protein
MTRLHTTLGPLERSALGRILPHEHVFVDLRTPDRPGYAQADAAEVVALMAPQVAAVQAQGVTALIECSTLGVGRRADLDLAVSQATGLPIVVPTGSYREPWITPFIASASDADLEALFVRELDERLDEADFRAGWIKISSADDGFTALEERILRAAARAALRTGALIGSHTIRGRVALDQLRVIESEGCPLSRFLWIHTQTEDDFGLHREAAARGAWIEYDDVGRDADTAVEARILRALDAGLGGQLLLSHDLGWFDPARPGGGTPRPWAHLFGTMLPRLAAAGVPAGTLDALTHDNPFRAFARP